MEGKIRKIFPGANTANGSFNFFDNIIQGDINRIFCFKGGPGVGKSSLMRKIAQEFIDRGYDVELHHCPSDPSSLDALLIKKLGVVLLDGTSPHIVDPKNPGAVDEIVNLGEFWNVENLEKNKDEITGLAGDLVSYCDSLIKFFTGDSKHAPFGIGQWCKLSKASASVWKGFYTVFKKSFSDEKTQNLFEKKFGSWATAVGVAGGLMGILGAVTEYSRNGSSTANIGKETVGFGKTLYLIGKDPVFKYPAHVYTSILQSAMDVAGQTYDSIHKYKEDGHWSLEDTAYTGIEASVKGLDTLLSKISFGVFSLKTAGTSAGDTAKWLEEKTTEIGEAAGKLIASNPESKQAFQNGNVAKRLQMIVQVMWQKK